MHIITAPFRLLLAALWLVLAIFSVLIVFLVVAPPSRQQAALTACKTFFCRRLLTCLHIEVEFIGQMHPNTGLVVSNHISWLDVLLMTHYSHLHFIAKSEVKDWPIIGFLTQLLGTLFIRRENKFQVYRSLPKGQKLLQRGESLMVFPEGTTTHGGTTRAFYPMLFEIAVREAAWVQPIAIRYWAHQDTPSIAVPFIDDDGIIGNILKLLIQKKTRAQVVFLPAIKATDYDRKALATLSKANIDRVLASGICPSTTRLTPFSQATILD